MAEHGRQEEQDRAGEPCTGSADDDDETGDRGADDEGWRPPDRRPGDGADAYELAGTASWMIRINAGYAGVPAATRTNSVATRNGGERQRRSRSTATPPRRHEPARWIKRIRRGSTRTNTAPATGEQNT